MYTDAHTDASTSEERTTGPRDAEGRWHGRVEKNIMDYIGYNHRSEISDYRNGVRHGWYILRDGNGKILTVKYYVDGKLADPPIGQPAPQFESGEAPSAASIPRTPEYRHIGNTRPWFLNDMEALFGIDPERLDSFLAGLESSVGAKNPLNRQAFETAFEKAVKELAASETHGDSTWGYQGILYRECGYAMKGLEPRLAALDRILGSGLPTVEILKASHAAFYQKMVAAGVGAKVIEAFFEDMDARMDAMAPPDPGDPLLAEAVDQRLRLVVGDMSEGLVIPEPGPNDGTDDGSLSAGRDAYAWNCGGDHSGDSSLLGGLPRSDCNQCLAKAYIRFDLDALPAEVENVTLGVTHMPQKGACTSLCAADFYFYPVLEDWNEMTIGSGSMPAEGGPVFGPLEISVPNDYGTLEYDITDIYRSWKDGSAPNHGLAVYSPDSGCVGTSATFAVYSSDNPDRDLRPYLRIDSDRYDLIAATLYRFAIEACRERDPVFQALLESYALHVSPDGLCGGRAPCYAEVQAAVDAAGGGFAEKISVAGGNYPESVVMNVPRRLELTGGHDASFAEASSVSILSGLEISNGTLSCRGIALGSP